MKTIFTTLARYNRWANARLYAELGKLTPEQLTAPSEVNFGSILAIANHLVLADRLWLNRFTGGGAPVPTIDAVPYPDLADLAAARSIEEERAEAFARGLDPARLESTLRYTTTEGTAMATPLALCLTHFFNHQTHHRGQIHGLLGACGIKAADIDLIGYMRELTE
ncbi:DinB family protein [Solidesulfovibrio fructosivorans JJ]]|uniref:DinB family protein n=1 Tax=Solidesulfovibrio fructosivorans JJ] TaxID=596151 RepID=E1JZS3_SOLFR|nr:DinB family protein [Solidesulfovibrio fructosivorans]EFL50103.1 DinB family protein [Solidesulfovibrio fructosivorans JJ]]